MTEAGQNVIRIRRYGEVSGMALVTISVHELVVTADMTGSARGRGVRPRQRELGRGVIEGGRLPGRCRMTCLARLTETA
jgi:hypothetical protein